MAEKIKVTVTVSRHCAREVNSAITKYLGGWIDPEEDDDFDDNVDRELERIGDVFEGAARKNKTINSSK